MSNQSFPAFKKKVEKSKLRIANPAKQKVKAAKLAKQKVIDKYYPKYKEMGLAQRVKTDQLIQQKYSGMINKLTMKLMKGLLRKRDRKGKESKRGNELMRKFHEQAGQVVFAFGRFNPPTIGHEKLMDKTKQIAGSSRYIIYPSQSQNQKKDPLPFALKVAYMRKMFPKHARKLLQIKV